MVNDLAFAVRFVRAAGARMIRMRQGVGVKRKLDRTAVSDADTEINAEFIWRQVDGALLPGQLDLVASEPADEEGMVDLYCVSGPPVRIADWCPVKLATPTDADTQAALLLAEQQRLFDFSAVLKSLNGY